MKKNIIILFIILFLGINNLFAQITGEYYAFDNRFLNSLTGMMKTTIKQVNEKGMECFGSEKNDFSLLNMGNNKYANKENTIQIVLRADGDFEQYHLDNDIIKEVFLFTKDKKNAKAKWKAVKKEMNAKIDKKGENSLLSYFYEDNKTIKLGEVYTGQEEIKIIITYKEGFYNDYRVKKIAEDTYVYYYDNRGKLSSLFVRFLPLENQLVLIFDPLTEKPGTLIGQKENSPAKNEANNKKIKDFQGYIQNYITKHRISYFNSFKSNTSADLSQAKIVEATKKYFNEEYTLTKVRLVTSAWTLERNEFGRTMRRLHTVLAYLKNKTTGKCYVAFRKIGQEFDGNSYGDVGFYKREDTHFDLVDDKNNVLQVYLVLYEYEIPCAEISK